MFGTYFRSFFFHFLLRAPNRKYLAQFFFQFLFCRCPRALSNFSLSLSLSLSLSRRARSGDKLRIIIIVLWGCHTKVNAVQFISYCSSWFFPLACCHKLRWRVERPIEQNVFILLAELFKVATAEQGLLLCRWYLQIDEIHMAYMENR